MEQPPAAKFFRFSSSSGCEDADLVELSVASSSFWQSRKRKSDQVDAPEIIDLEKDDDQDVVVIDGNISGYKNKQPMKYDKTNENLFKDDFYKVGSSSHNLFDNVALVPLNAAQSSMPISQDFCLPDGFNYGVFDFDESYYKGIELDAELAEFSDNLDSKFDGWNIPSGVEANVPWLHNLNRGEPSSSFLKQKAIPSSSQVIIVDDDEADLKFKAFKQFETVQGDKDHHFSKPEHIKGIRVLKKASKDWTKRIQHEWKVMEKDLPDMIYVRVYEDRMDILRAVIIGPAGTPYHDGLFFFDAYFPPNYPYSPPLVHYHSGGLRLNPNLYACGKVCLSLLGTWSGSGCEKWNSSKSTMLQVLVSIQALVLNAKPYFNEPGYANSANTPAGELRSRAYNEDTFLLSCRTMLYSLRRPPKHFEEFAAAHFRKCGRAILVACEAYLQGAQVGCLASGGVQDVDEGESSCTEKFRSSLKVLFKDLVTEFIAKGVDCKEFLKPGLEVGNTVSLHMIPTPNTMLNL